MDFSHVFLFSMTFFLAVLSPGPATTSVVAHALSYKYSGTLALILGLLFGDFFWLSLALAGLTALAKTYATGFMILKGFGALYLLFLAYKLWTLEPKFAIDIETKKVGVESLFLTGLLINISNPKAGVFYMALLPTLVDLEHVRVLDILVLVALISVILVSVCFGYAYLGVQARSTLTNTKSLKILNRLTSFAFVGAAIAVVSR